MRVVTLHLNPRNFAPLQELSGVSEAARELAMSRFRLIQPHLEKTGLYNSSQPMASSRFEPLSAG
jgi:hypothetical protein